MTILLLPRPWSGHDDVHPLQVLLARERFDVHFGSPDGIGMEREGHVKHFQGLVSRERSLDEILSDLIPLAADDRRSQPALDASVQ